MQRRKQYPDLAYRSNEVIQHDGGHHTKDATDLRARSEERDFGTTSKSGPRSRSAEPGMNHNQQKLIMIQSFPPISSGRVSVLPKTDEFPNITEPACETTEYKSQFAWPRKPQTDVPCMARKSVSMGVIKGSEETDASVPKSKLAPIRRPCVKQKEVKNVEKTVQEVKKKVKTEYKAKYKPFTSYVYVDGQWKKTSRLLKVPEKEVEANQEPWFVEVVERLQKANEYRWRGHGHPVYGELLPDIYKQPPDRPASHSKVIPPELQINQPKCHLLPSKKTDSKKKEVHHDAVPERKREKDAKTAPLLKRPKSAEPAKVKEPIKHRRPATTPPAKSTTRALPSKKRLSKDEDILKPVKAKPPPPSSSISKKTKEDTVKSSSSNKKSPIPSSQSSGGKVWLQAGQPASEPKGDDSSFREHSDAVRPSSLSPISAASVPASEPSQKEYNNVEAESDKKQFSDETKSATPHSSVVPLTHVRTPEEVTGVKSPDPENWTVPIESSERLEWSGVNTPETSENIKPQEGISEKLSKLSVNDESVPSVMPSEVTATTAPGSSKSTPANVLDRARSRLDQFWGKNK